MSGEGVSGEGLSGEGGSLSSRTKILVVDDEPHILKLLELKLSLENYQVITAGSGSEALERVAIDAPDLVLLDVMMPGIDGFQVASALKGDPLTREIPILFLTARGRDADRKHGEEVGAVEYITKPFRLSELVTLIRKHL